MTLKSLEGGVKRDVFGYGEIIVETIMLRTHSYEGSNFINLSLTEDRNVPIGWLSHSCNHGNRGGLSCPVVS